jgi:hypothetical protein
MFTVNTHHSDFMAGGRKPLDKVVIERSDPTTALAVASQKIIGN